MSILERRFSPCTTPIMEKVVSELLRLSQERNDQIWIALAGAPGAGGVTFFTPIIDIK
jgi:hypothetical protein